MAADGLVLNGLNLNDETNFGLEAIDFTPPKKRAEFAPGADSDGASLIRTPLYENRTVTMTVRVGPQTTMDLALEKIGSLVDQLQEAEQNPGGIPLEWTPAGATKKVTLYVLTGEVTGIPMVVEGGGAGWYVGKPTPQLTVSLTCLPFGYGTEVVGAAAKANETGLSIVVLTVPTVVGDVPAEGRLILKDTAAVGRRFLEWGLQQRYYDAATSLVIAAESLTAVGGAASEAANTGAYKPGAGTKLTIATTLLAEPTICCNTGVLKHVGTFRVKARAEVVLGAESHASNVHVRLGWQDGEGPIRGNEWQTPNRGGKYVELDLGTITVTPAILGTQKWLGQIEAYSGNKPAADVLHINYLTFVPVAEGYGKARGATSSATGTVSAFDNFTTGTLSGSLSARTPAVGAAWVTSGAATDFAVAAGQVTRSTKSDAEPRYGVIGAAVGNSVVRVTALPVMSGGKEPITLATVARWTDASNHVFAEFVAVSNGVTERPVELLLGTKVAGARTVLASKRLLPNVTPAIGGTYTLTLALTVTLDGAISVSGTVVYNVGGFSEEFALTATSTAVATGGALASGKGGVYDQNKDTHEYVRAVSSVNVSTLAAVPYCIQPSRSMEVHSDSTITFDSTGTYAGPPPSYRGSRFYVPQDGAPNRTSRVIVKADRNDLEESDQQTIADAFTAEVKVTPRYVAIPR